MSASGLYTAGPTPSVFAVTGTEQDGSSAALSQVTVVAPHMTALAIAPKSCTLQPGQAAQLSTNALWSDWQSHLYDASYSAIGGTITSGGLFTVGAFLIIATCTCCVVDTAHASIEVAPAVLTSLKLSPSTVTLTRRAPLQFVVSALWSDGSPTIPPVNDSATRGTITAGGQYAAGSTTGRYRKIATFASASDADTSTVTNVPARVATVAITPTTCSLFAGNICQLTATPKGGMGNALTGRVITWMSGNAVVATVSGSGLATAISSGSASVIATSEGKSLAIQVTTRAVGKSITIYPGDDIQTAVTNFPLGTTFVIKAGVHRLQQIMPKGGDAFVGEPGAILSGAKLLTAFSRSGIYWVASDQAQHGKTAGTCIATRPECIYPEDLFFDNVPLIHVGSLARVVPGTWFFDYAGHKIYFVDNPTGHAVEASSAAHAFFGAIRDVTISGIVVEKYANPAQTGAIDGSTSARWIVQNNEVRLNHGIGIRTGDGMQVINNRVHDQGQLGVGGGGTAVLVQNNEIAFNNTAGFSWYWEAGGTKFAYTTGLIVQGNNFHDNHGPGLWTDINNINTTYENNTITNNDGAGIDHEVSYAAVIRDNVISGNGWGSKNYRTWPEGSGIMITSSSNVEVYGNTLLNNANGIGLIQASRGTGAYGPLVLSNFYAHDNTITQPTGFTGAVTDTTDDAVFTVRNNRFMHNTYILGSNPAPFRWMRAVRTAAEWRAYGNDVDGTFTPEL